MDEFGALAEVHAEAERAADYRAAVLALPIRNYLRDTEAHPEPLGFGDIFPSLADLDEQEDTEGDEDEMSPEETKAYLIAMMQGLGGKPVRMEAA